MLFSVVMYEAVKKASKKTKNTNLEYWRMHRIQISELLCPDNMVIMAEKYGSLT